VGSAVVLIVAVLTAIAIPVFLDQRSRTAEPQATSITLPPTVAGMSEVQDPAVQDQPPTDPTLPTVVREAVVHRG
jgi:hypothetical protein